MARQLASQRTAAAIPGPGPIQSDLFPLLEYIAPRAFFRSEFTRVLEPFDERTYQQLLAPLEKRNLLGSLRTEDVQMVFEKFLSVNRNLYNAATGRPLTEEIPVVFQTPAPTPPPAATGSLHDAAAQAFAAGDLARARGLVEYALQMDPQDWRAAYLGRVIERAGGSVRLQ
jgi:hypothetical protein